MFQVGPPNPRIKLTACGTLTHGKKRRRSHAAAYPHRWADKYCEVSKILAWVMQEAGPGGPAQREGFLSLGSQLLSRVSCRRLEAAARVVMNPSGIASGAEKGVGSLNVVLRGSEAVVHKSGICLQARRVAPQLRPAADGSRRRRYLMLPCWSRAPNAPGIQAGGRRAAAEGDRYAGLTKMFSVE
jgi:hypothetical protein